MSEDVDKKLEELRNEESTGNRLDRDDPESQPEFADVLEEALESIDQGESSNTITAYDPKLAAVLQALEEDDRMEDVFEQLQEAYDGNSGLQNPSRSALIRLAVRVGLQEGSDNLLADLEEAVNRRQTTTI
ncbi:hypothetical protein [Haloquadratum walsbyi]|jgi:hypothetical protein|uniref:DUF8115 domain-containing protein n=1 Tax=Haloquadratum walsbyi (strain DSM 16790 / HBSQ001) TaxID=362976 RepID=Q18DF0_HALWD|nr:hypothetical protein [Haloquadratum walsbyi]CAJ51117.1 uncharacterized protein HQ_4027A [Haloquadratum walsbyi DSM 16790]